MAEHDILKEVISQAPNRRKFVRNLGLAGAALGIGSAVKVAKAQSTSAPNDFDILNFALNLEYLEAEFYTVATTGMTIDQLGYTVTGAGTSGSVTGGAAVAFAASDAVTQAIALEIAQDERTHVALLQSAIASYGGQAIARPAINLNALGFGFGSVSDFLKLARIFEDIGVTAYGGAAPLISNSAILGTAARILAAEAEHVAALRLLIAQQAIPTTALDGADIIPPPSGTQYFSLNSSALSEIRTPGQVLYLAFDAPSATSGGFFPSGVNGTLNTSDATPAVYDGTVFTATPNPVTAAAGQDGVTTLTWSAPTATVIQIHVGSPTGPLFTDNIASGSMATGAWVTNGMVFYLQDVTNGKALTQANTLATLTVTVTTSV